MKSCIFLILLCICLAGCRSTPPVTPTEAPTQAQTEIQTEVPTQAPTAPAATQAPTEPVTEPVLVSYTLYLPNENADGFVPQTVQTERITADGVLEQLQKAGALPDTVIINAFGSQGDQLNLDFNSAFADAVNSMGTSGERMIIGSLVNTFLNAFQAQSLAFTVEGEILESGHVAYDFPLTFFE